MRGNRASYMSVAVALLLAQTVCIGAQSEFGAKMQAAAAAENTAPSPHRILFSGHSLTNEPIPSDLTSIAASLGLNVLWNRQYLEGSSIKQRSLGLALYNARLTSDSQGLDYLNRPIDVPSELRRPSRHPDQPYDTLVITEQHNLLGTLAWNGTVRYLRDYHDEFIKHNSDGRTYFFEPWLSLDDKGDPSRWIAYERAAAPVWRCIVEQMNRVFVAEGRRDRMVSLPAALALAYLIERAAPHGPGLPSITRSTMRSTLDSLFVDDVHLTRLGNYYIALVTFAYMFRKSPVGAWHPADVNIEQAKALQDVAATVTGVPQPAAMPIAACRDYVLRSFMWTYLSYSDVTHWRKERAYFRYYIRFKFAAQWFWLFSRDTSKNPFTDAAYKRP